MNTCPDILEGQLHTTEHRTKGWLGNDNRSNVLQGFGREGLVIGAQRAGLAIPDFAGLNHAQITEVYSRVNKPHCIVEGQNALFRIRSNPLCQCPFVGRAAGDIFQQRTIDPRQIVHASKIGILVVQQ